MPSLYRFTFFFFNDTATTEIYTLSLHDALPIAATRACQARMCAWGSSSAAVTGDRKSTRLNSSHLGISYAVFCLKKKKQHYRKLFLNKQITQNSTLQLTRR